MIKRKDDIMQNNLYAAKLASYYENYDDMLKKYNTTEETAVKYIENWIKEN